MVSALKMALAKTIKKTVKQSYKITESHCAMKAVV